MIRDLSETLNAMLTLDDPAARTGERQSRGRALVVQRQSWSEQLGYFAGLMVDAQGIEPWTSPV
jgi:hypothetical protein